MLLAAAAILFGSSYLMRTPVPLTVQGAIVIFGAVGAAVAWGFLKITNPQDFYGGMALVLLALVAFVASNDLPGMRGFAFGPGTAPRLFAFALGVLSAAVAIMGLLTRGPVIGQYKVRGVLFITCSILIFAATIRPLGLVIASFSCIVLCAAAAEDIKWRETIVWAAVLTTFVSVLFPWGLNLPFQLWPRFY
jgi:putative tricarboxylic transport membrane protein